MKRDTYIKGYFLACAVLVRMHGESTEADDLVNAYGETKEIIKAKIDKEDYETLKFILED